MSARDNILARIRSQTGKPGPTSDADREAVRTAISVHVRGPIPSLARHEPIAHFKHECTRLKTTLAEVASLDDIPHEIARYLAAEALPRKINGWCEFAALDWTSAGIAFTDCPANGGDGVGLTGCFCAIGETGTLLLLGAKATPKVTALLPETHICIVKKSRIVPTMEDAFTLMRSEVGEPPRSVFFVSGPSRTADIEQTLVIGAHGPYRVHVILVP